MTSMVSYISLPRPAESNKPKLLPDSPTNAEEGQPKAAVHARTVFGELELPTLATHVQSVFVKLFMLVSPQPGQPRSTFPSSMSGRRPSHPWRAPSCCATMGAGPGTVIHVGFGAVPVLCCSVGYCIVMCFVLCCVVHRPVLNCVSGPLSCVYFPHTATTLSFTAVRCGVWVICCAVFCSGLCCVLCVCCVFVLVRIDSAQGKVKCFCNLESVLGCKKKGWGTRGRQIHVLKVWSGLSSGNVWCCIEVLTGPERNLDPQKVFPNSCPSICILCASPNLGCSTAGTLGQPCRCLRPRAWSDLAE